MDEKWQFIPKKEDATKESFGSRKTYIGKQSVTKKDQKNKTNKSKIKIKPNNMTKQI